MTKQSKNAKRRSQKQANQAAQRDARRAYMKRRYWHGGVPGLRPGAVLVGFDNATGTRPNYERVANRADDPTRTDRVYFTTDKELARSFAADCRKVDTTTGIVYRHGDLYEVEPIGSIEPDPDFFHSVSWRAPQARVTAVAETNVNLDPYESTRCAAEHLAWTDGSPVYTPHGGYQRSPEQLAAGFDHPVFQFLPPWTPLAHINAWIAGERAGDRPEPLTHAGVMMQAAESIDISRMQQLRSAQFVESGLRISQSQDVGTINEFLGGAAVLDHGDSRGTVVVTSGSGRLVAALVLTAMNLAGTVCMFIDTMKTAPQWQHRGIGSVLLLSSPTILPERPSFIAGQCSTPTAEFFSQLGFTVLRPGVPIFIPTGTDDATPIASSNPDSCWFYRQGQL